ncbi:MAG TPA: RsmE family RNA methyltransferase [Terriglobales bacterium]|nr:RsmE family RNA methyltransferase [Terriglobales bacterium]
MTRRRWIADRVEGDHAYLLGQNATHLFRVLRAQPGQQFDVVANGLLRLGTIMHATSDQVEFHLGEEVVSQSVPEISVYLAVFKFDRMEWALEKLTELGVARIQPVIAGRTAAHLVAAADRRVERWRKITREAAQQARRLEPPRTETPLAFKHAISNCDDQSRIVLSELEETAHLKTVLSALKPPLALALGPEGGWTEEEADSFHSAGWKSASLGPTILRAETAAIAAVAVALAEMTVF